MWVPQEFRHQAEVTGATVVDRSSVITTHLAEIVRRNAGRLLGRQDVKLLIDVVKQSDPVVIDELNGASVTTGEIQRVLQMLLDEGVASATSCRIFEVVSERSRVHEGSGTDSSKRCAPRSVPRSRRRTPRDGKLPVMTLDPLVEHALADTLRSGDHGSYLAIDPQTAEQLALAVAQRSRSGGDEGDRAGARVRDSTATVAAASCCTRPPHGFRSSLTRSSASSSSSTRSGW